MVFLFFFLMVPPPVMRGVYLSPGVLSSGKGERMLVQLIRQGVINAVVMDLKDERGTRYFRLCREKLQMYKKLGVYTIGRLPVFKDEFMAKKENGTFGLKTPEGYVWQDPIEGYWANPEDRMVWDYNIELAKRGFEMGFDEIQFDYIRYPSSHIPYIRTRNKTEVLCEFLDTAYARLKNMGWLGVDLYGFVCWQDTIPLEGQAIKHMGIRVDAVYPMLYPSHFGNNFLLDGSRERRTYEIVYLSLLNARYVLPYPEKRVVAYIQAFDWKRSTMGEKYIKNQIKAAMDAVKFGCNGFILWEAGGNYKKAYEELLEFIEEAKENGDYSFLVGHPLPSSG